MQEDRYLTIGEVAAELGMPRWRLAYLVERGAVPDAAVRVPGRRLFTPEDVAGIRQALEHRSAATYGTTPPN